jgi:hypothetical protein
MAIAAHIFGIWIRNLKKRILHPPAQLDWMDSNP